MTTKKASAFNEGYNFKERKTCGETPVAILSFSIPYSEQLHENIIYNLNLHFKGYDYIKICENCDSQMSQPLCESVASKLLCVQVSVFKCISIQILFCISLFAVMNIFVIELWKYIFFSLVFQFKNAAAY